MEAFAFILPALPSSIWIRLAILLTYLIMHYYKIQYKYVQFKNKYVTPRIQEEKNVDFSLLPLEKNVKEINHENI